MEMTTPALNVPDSDLILPNIVSYLQNLALNFLASDNKSEIISISQPYN